MPRGIQSIIPTQPGLLVGCRMKRCRADGLPMTAFKSFPFAMKLTRLTYLATGSWFPLSRVLAGVTVHMIVIFHSRFSTATRCASGSLTLSPPKPHS